MNKTKRMTILEFCQLWGAVLSTKEKAIVSTALVNKSLLDVTYGYSPQGRFILKLKEARP